MWTILRRRRGRRGADEGSALLVVIFAILTVSALSVLLLGFVLSQVAPTRSDSNRVQAVHAAESGLDVALGRIRTAVNSTDPRIWDLPCTTGGAPITGPVDGAAGLSYSVTITYLDAEKNPTSSCTRHDIRYADITSRGATPRDAAVRTLSQRYTLHLTDAHIVGGPLRALANPSLCVTSSTALGDNGSAVTLEACDAHDPAQNLAYRSDYTLGLVSSDAADGTPGTCLTADAPDAAEVSAIHLRSCTAGADQQWGYDGGYDFFVNNARRCLTTPDRAAVAGSALVAVRCDNEYSGTFQWTPDPETGPGSIPVDATDDEVVGKTMQWLNYAEFGRCIDVAYEQPVPGILINYPCKQDPSGVPPKWNQVFRWDRNSSTAAGPLVTTAGGADFCITSLPAGGVVNMKPCQDNRQDQQWTVHRAGPVFSSYSVIDSYGNCLQPDPAQEFASNISLEVTAPCTGSLRQKWNAPVLGSDPGLANLQEHNSASG